MEIVARVDGYYWVKREMFDFFEVGHWNGILWSFKGESIDYDNVITDKQLSEINETPIPSPDDLIKIDQSTKDDSPTSPLDLSQGIEDFVNANPVLHSIFFKHYRANE